MNSLPKLKQLTCALMLNTALAVPALAATSGDPIDIQVVLPSTGTLAFLGASEQRDLVIEQKLFNDGNGIHGHPVNFVFHDDQSTPQIAVQISNQIIADKPKLILGTALVGSCNAMAPLMHDGPVMYCFSPGIHPAKGSYVFSSNVSTADLFNVTLRYYRLRGWTKIAILTATDASGQDAEKGIKKQLALPENKDMQLVAEARFNPTDVSADAQIQRMKAADPQAIITWTSGSSLGTILRAISDAGWDVPVTTSDSNMNYRQMAQYTAFVPKQFYIPAPQWLPSANTSAMPAEVQAAQKQMNDAFKAANVRPDIAMSLSWDPTLIAISALNKLPADADATALRDYMLNLKGFAGINGVYDMTKVPQRGIGVDAVVMTLWQPEQKNWVVVSKPTGLPF